MSTNASTADITAQLDAWGINYTETTDGLRSGTITLAVTNERPATAIITQGDTLIGITSSADKAAALIAWPLYRAAWDAGYQGDVDIETHPDTEEVEVTFSYGGEDVTILAGYDWAPGQEFTVIRHPLLWDDTTMTDLAAAFESTELAYQNPSEAWQALCGADDYEQDSWETIVETLAPSACITGGARLAKVDSGDSRIALVENCGPESPTRVIDVNAAEDATYWSPQDAAAAILVIIA